MQTVEKWATRSDAWTPDDDTRLADLVLNHIRIGSTQLKAFEEAAKMLGRTPAACGYRWNGVVRKHYRDGIETAKHARKSPVESAATDTPALPLARNTSASMIDHRADSQGATSESIKDVIHFLEAYDTQYQKLRLYLTQVEGEKVVLAQRVEALQDQLKTKPPIPEKSVSPKQLEEDSRTLFAIMERARKLLGDTGRQHAES